MVKFVWVFLILSFFTCCSESTSVDKNIIDSTVSPGPIIKMYPHTFFANDNTPFTVDASIGYDKVGRRIIYPVFPGGADSLSSLVGSRLRINSTLTKNDSLYTQVDFSVDSTGLLYGAEIKSGIDSEFDLQLLEIINGLKITPAYLESNRERIWRPGKMWVKIKFIKKQQ